MPYSSFSLTTAAGQAHTAHTVESGILESVMVAPEHTGIGNAEAYAELYIGTTETPDPTPVAMLASGYIGASHPIGWTGQIVMEPSFCILVRIWCQTAFTFIVGVLVLQE